jgi:hypothetical protein
MSECPMIRAGLATCDRCFSDPEGFEECCDQAAWWESLLNPEPVELDEIEAPLSRDGGKE